MRASIVLYRLPKYNLQDVFFTFFKINILFQAFVSTTGYRIRSEPLVKRGLSDPDDPRWGCYLKLTHL